MVDFLKIDLDQRHQPADVRLRDDTTNSEIVITQARFNSNGAIINRLRSGNKAKEFFLTPDEMDVLTDAWMDYRGALIAHAREVEERKEQAIAEAKALAKSVTFDLDSLNVKAKRDGDYWRVVVPALAFNQTCYVEQLKNTVQDALNDIQGNVENAEQFHWTGDAFGGNEWSAIIASYRRAFPLVTEQGEICPSCGLKCSGTGHECPQEDRNEPAEITEARALLKEALHLADWAQCSIYPGSEPDTWSFDNGLEMNNVLLLDHPAGHILDFVSQYITETKRGEGESDQMIADFWAGHRTEQASEPSRSA